MEYFSMTLKEVMENLEQELNQKYSEIMTPLGYYIASELFIELLESVDYLHKQNIIHRNLKPLNILITHGINDRFTRITGFWFSDLS
jgi:serine/threonine protein kinase